MTKVLVTHPSTPFSNPHSKPMSSPHPSPPAPAGPPQDEARFFFLPFSAAALCCCWITAALRLISSRQASSCSQGEAGSGLDARSQASHSEATMRGRGPLWSYMRPFAREPLQGCRFRVREKG